MIRNGPESTGIVTYRVYRALWAAVRIRGSLAYLDRLEGCVGSWGRLRGFGGLPEACGCLSAHSCLSSSRSVDLPIQPDRSV